MLTQVANEIWVARQRLATLGVQYGARMTIIRLKNRELLLISPIKSTDELRQSVKDLGNVSYILAPSSFHHIFLKPWAESFPTAKVILLEQHLKKRPDLKADMIIDETFISPWPNDVSIIFMRGGKMYSEAILFHHSSRTLVVTDLCFHMQHAENFFSKIMLSLYGVYQKFGPSKAVALFISDKTYLRQIIEKICQWDFARVIVAHGEIADPLTPVEFRAAFTNMISNN